MDIVNFLGFFKHIISKIEVGYVRSGTVPMTDQFLPRNFTECGLLYPMTGINPIKKVEKTDVVQKCDHIYNGVNVGKT